MTLPKGKHVKNLITATLLVAGVSMVTDSFALTRSDELGEPADPALADRTLRERRES